MLITALSFFAWLYFSPINLLLGLPIGVFPPLPVFIINIILYAPLIFYIIRYWMRLLAKRQSGSAAGIDTVEPTRGVPEPGDEWGRATRPYSPEDPARIPGSKSEIRESPYALDSGFFVKTPDLETGEELFDADELRAGAMMRSRVSSGGWVDKRVASRAVGSLKASDTPKHGRPFRSRMPSGEVGSIDIPSTVMAAIVRSGRIPRGERIRIQPQDIREKVFSGRTPLTVILVIDVSLSMKDSMPEVRKVIKRIERETRGSKDRIGLIAFKDSGAIEVQAPTSNWNKLYRGLSRLRISGLTPLAEGIMKALETIRRERMRSLDVEPLVVVISDFAPNIPLAQSVGPGNAQYTPVRDLVKAARVLRKKDTRLVTINVDKEQVKWTRFLNRPYHDALELGTMLRMMKEGYKSVIETILAVPEFRKSFGSYLVATAGGGRTFLSSEVLGFDSVLGEFLAASRKRVKIDAETLDKAEAYILK
ncbi:MAG: VWA domain-containing protein [Candidatus Thorarchaeota archaeon]|nr:MAG: VWA domain-containing protein [Candidatus Thorarchaeota archaeon]